MLATLGTSAHWKVQCMSLKISVLWFLTIKCHHFAKQKRREALACLLPSVQCTVASSVARQEEVLVDGHVRQGRKGILDYSLVLCVTEVGNWSGCCTWGRLSRRQANIKYIDKSSFYCMKKYWCSGSKSHKPTNSVSSDIVQMVQLWTSMFLLVLVKGLSSEPALAQYILWLLRAKLLCWAWGSVGASGNNQTHPQTLVESVRNRWHVSEKAA